MKRYVISLSIIHEDGYKIEKEGVFEIVEVGTKKHQPNFEVYNGGIGAGKTQLSDGDYSSICGFIDGATENPDPARAEKILKKINTMLWMRSIV